MKKIIVFGKHYEKINSVFGERPNNSLALCSEFQLRVKKKLNEGPENQLEQERKNRENAQVIPVQNEFDGPFFIQKKNYSQNPRRYENGQNT